MTGMASSSGAKVVSLRKTEPVFARMRDEAEEVTRREP